MYLKKVALIGLLLALYFGHAQQPSNFGKLTSLEKEMLSYEKDTSAHAVVLYERGDNYFKVVDNYIRLFKEYHVKIKIFDEKGFDEGNIAIRLSKSETASEKLTQIKAVTHNGNEQFSVLPSEMYDNDVNQYRKEKTFTFPKLQKGSIIEYAYTIQSPFIYNFRGWDFQAGIPKIYSEFNATIPANYEYNRALIGTLALSTNDASIKKECFHIEGFPTNADCEILKYAMKDIPAFKIEEEYMLAPSNYISRLDFELSKFHKFDGTTDKYTETWEAVDRDFRSNKDIGRQLYKNDFFEKNVPENLLTDADPLTRAKNIYTFVRNHFSWNEEYGIFNKARVKEAFENKSGNVSEINMSLINLLNAAGIKTHLMLLSTRQSGLPKKIHPVMADFNYMVAKTSIDGKDYLLDATDKYMPFGMLPFRALNHYGRVMDFEKDSYWYDFRPQTMSKYQARAQVNFDVGQNKAEGVVDLLSTGYSAVATRKALEELDEETYMDRFEEDFEGDIKITFHEVRKELSDEEKVSERFKFEMANVIKGDMLYLDPFLIHFFDQNPFLLDKRNYPVDFGYPRNYKYSINIGIPQGYAVHGLPEKQVVQLGDKLVILQFSHLQDANQLNLVFDLSLNSSHINPEDYENLKTVFKHVIQIQNNTLVVFKKI